MSAKCVTTAGRRHEPAGRRNPFGPPGRRRRGIVIVVVTVVILLVSLAAYGFLTLMQTENKAALARGDQLQAQSVAASGREYLARLLERPRSERPVEAERDDVSDGFQDILVDGESDESDEFARRGRFSILASNHGDMRSRGWRFGYENESAKIHLALLLDLERQQPGAGQDALMNLPNMDESTADAILDWIDEDDERRGQGAESEYYSGLNPPRSPRNAVPPALEELLLVKGVTRRNLFGADRNADFKVDASEEQGERQTGGMVSAGTKPWRCYLTVHGGERDERHDGGERIRLNQSDLAALHRELSAAFDPGWANFIVAYRQYGPYSGSESGGEASALSVDLSQPAEQEIESPLELIDARVAIPVQQGASGGRGNRGSANRGSANRGSANRGSGNRGSGNRHGANRPRGPRGAVDRAGQGNASPSNTGDQDGDDEMAVFASPFTSDPGQMREYLPRLMDGVTVGSGSPIYGRINVNLAPPEVLAALPGLDMATAERVASSRSMSAMDTEGRRHAAWLLVEDIVDLAGMRRLEPYVTTGGAVGRAQIIGYYDRGGPVTRFETVLDATEPPARQVYYKGLRRLGRGLAEEVMTITSQP